MITYIKATDADLYEVANIHKERFPDHYLGKFSISLLYRFYKNLLDSNQIFIVAKENQKVIGFVVGGEIQVIKERLSFFIKKNVLFYGFEILIRPNTWVKSFEKLKGIVIKQPSNQYNLDDHEPYTLLSIATAKDSNGKGVGTGLVNAFDDELIKVGDHYHLAVMESNVGAIRFYEKNGFTVANRLPDELQMMKYLSK